MKTNPGRKERRNLARTNGKGYRNKALRAEHNITTGAAGAKLARKLIAPGSIGSTRIR